MRDVARHPLFRIAVMVVITVVLAAVEQELMHLLPDSDD